MLSKTTVNKLWEQFYELEEREYTGECCQVCGRYYGTLNNHHLVKSSAGELYRDGKVAPKPLITLCGFGNNLQDADGRYYCHGLAHHNMLHFKVEDGELYYNVFSEPIKYDEALKQPGWKKVQKFD